MIAIPKEHRILDTPPALAAHMVELADIKSGHRVLEPSAGSGAIIDAIVHKHEGIELEFCEMHERLATVLEHNYGQTPISRDFMMLKPSRLFDRVIMNPPSRDWQDASHIHKAYDVLAPGGRIVALTYPHWQSSQDFVYTEFRRWLSHTTHAVSAVRQGYFEEKSVEPVILVVFKP